jgi:hypothetical protein
LNDGQIQNPSKSFGIVPLSRFVPRDFGFVHHSIAILYHEVPNPNITIRNFFIAVGGGRALAYTFGVESSTPAAAVAAKSALAAAAVRSNSRLASLARAKSLRRLRGVGARRSQLVRYSDAKVANRNGRDFGWVIAHAAVSRRPPISLYRIVARTHLYTYAAKAWDLSLVQGPFPVAPCQTPTLRFATFLSLYENGA